jgi:phosphomannomutase
VSIFKAYDIRGVVPDELRPDDAYWIGRAIARFLGAPDLVVGRDARSSSPALFESLVRGVNREGVAVLDIGMVATPMLYFAVDHLGAGGGIMLTASHNPAQYNGFKVCREHAIPIGEASGLKEIERTTAQLAASPDEASPASGPSRPMVRQIDVVKEYVEHVLAVGEGRPRLRVAIDCGHGSTSSRTAAFPITRQIRSSSRISPTCAKR